jgi:cyclic pyranopterin phosphate synthase
MRGVNDDELYDFVSLTQDRPINVRFIEYMPFDGNVWSDKKMVPYREMMSRVRSTLQQQQFEDSPPLSSLDTAASNSGNRCIGTADASSREISSSSSSSSSSSRGASSEHAQLLERLEDPTGEVAKNFRVPGHAGIISFVTSMTSHFCGECNRCAAVRDEYRQRRLAWTCSARYLF